MEDLIPLLRGSTAIAFVKGDAVVAAKNLDEVARRYPALVVKGGILGGKVLDADQARTLASVAPREVLLAQLAALLASPVEKVASLLYAPLVSLGTVFYALQQKQGGSAPDSDNTTNEDSAGDAGSEG